MPGPQTISWFLITIGAIGVTDINLDSKPLLNTLPEEPCYLIMMGKPSSFTDEFPVSPPGSHRYMGFGVKIRMLDTSQEDLVLQIEQAFDTAENTGYPVLITLDDWNFPKVSSDPEVIEWTDWPDPGEAYGPSVRGRWVSWGFWFYAPPPPNFESIKFRSDVEKRLRQVILPPIITRLDKWKTEGRDYLFAGLVVGWESGFYTFFTEPDPDNLPIIEDRGRKHSFRDKEFSKEDLIGTGYAALTARGYNAEKIQALSLENDLTEQEMIKELMADVINDYIGFIAITCRSAGIPREKLYSHIAGMGSFPDDFLEHIDMANDGRVLPVETAVHEACRPGITITYEWCDLDTIASVFLEKNESAWGAVELEVTNAIRDEESALAYLRRLSDTGAKIINVYGWWEPEGHIFQVRGTGAVKAMKQWLME